MAETKIILNKEEVEEEKEILKTIKSLKKKDTEKLKGFLEGIAFIHTTE
ncbi:MAG: hypothetical protein N4Q79_05670 [Lactobacillus iners]|nr:hypothetical protein [Lactobacillus crispatus]MCT7811102.1 hypothetical protein [Lactobacillus iners]MCT7838874.1 hypothetical protein [Lactobacillus iners]